jgi:hypothetical protein
MLEAPTFSDLIDFIFYGRYVGNGIRFKNAGYGQRNIPAAEGGDGPVEKVKPALPAAASQALSKARAEEDAGDKK